jgi:IclR family transcriptional regulator, KDG regulon repressor
VSAAVPTPASAVASGTDAAVLEASGNKATGRVLAVLAAFTDGAASFGVSELSRRLGMNKSMVHRALATLFDEGYLIRDPSGSRYQLGYRVLELAGFASAAPDLSELCGPYMRKMFEVSGETIALTVRRGRFAVTIGGIQAPGTVARRVPIGRVVPLHISGAARAILAFLTDEEVAEYLREGELQRATPASLATAEQVWADVRLTRDQGHALGLYDHAPNAYGVAFPVLDQAGRPHGSVTVSGPKDRLTPERLDSLMPELVEVAGELNRHSRLYRAAGDADDG